MKTGNTFANNSKNKEIICYSCCIPVHKTFKCRKNKGRKFRNFCNSSSHNNKTFLVNRKAKLKIIAVLPISKH